MTDHKKSREVVEDIEVRLEEVFEEEAEVYRPWRDVSRYGLRRAPFKSMDLTWCWRRRSLSTAGPVMRRACGLEPCKDSEGDGGEGGT